MAVATDLSTRFALDVQAVDGLRATAKGNGRAGLEAVARQFEALFLNMMLKSMREATPQDGPMDNEQSRMFTAMLDQQLSQGMASRGVGLAEVMVRQLRHALPPDPSGGEGDMQGAGEMDSIPVPPHGARGTGSLPASLPAALQSIRVARRELPADPGSPPSGAPSAEPRRTQEAAASSSWLPPQAMEFQARLMPYARQASAATGIPARFMLGQAALESGWGRREIRGADGAPSHNLFGVKAGSSWKGPVVETMTTEYVDGVPRKSVEKFRAYASYAEAFKDYVQLLSSNPRYADLLSQAARGLDAEGFAQGLQRAGYATDPDYAGKLGRIIRTTPWS